jgi:aminoglycoside phosphotransferase (APT) family kinase protein
VLAGLLPVPVPAPVRVGRPSELLDRPWTVVRWVTGTPADVAPLGLLAAGTLARVLRSLHVPAPAGAPVNDSRGIPLAPALLPERALDEVVDDAPRDRLDAVWGAALAAPAWDGSPRWLHGDLHPANVVGDATGDLVGLLDFGDLCAGDPATDLSAAWLLLPDGAAEPFLDAYGGVDDATTARARGWAVLRAVGLLQIGRAGRLGRPGGKPTWEPAGRAALRRVLAG